ncbi:hypothetical protein PYW07_008534 [Mythimna separata]|uniref:Peptidoglycan-recognition protein n=1 Tax=Mythimna separata TaxID=271217 RepID=A0AAD7YDQ3_MYTSE|nr:hypothetical protein PYW07_008534 [Mythimna separata]
MTSYTVLLSFVLIGLLSAHASPRLVSKSRNFRLYSKADWLGEPATWSRPLNQPVPYVVLHHTYIPAACFTMADCAAKMRSMQRYHNSLGWGDIGYNFCVGSEGGAYEGRGFDIEGIHASIANRHSIGICLIGDWRVETPTAVQLETTKALIAEGVKLGKISPNYKLIGHDQVSATECPGTAFTAEFSTWKNYAPGKPTFPADVPVVPAATA